MGQLNKFREIMVCGKNFIHDICRQMNNENADMVENIPNPLYKYYAINSNYDTQRISGELYFSSPIDFNDPYDCQTDVCNNLKEFMRQRPDDGKEWVKSKLHELGFTETESEDLFMRIQKDDTYAVKEVHDKQIEKLGILCLTTNCMNIIMWAHYTDNHKGYCLEYNTIDIMRDITIDFINKMGDDLIEFLWDTKEYYKNPIDRSKDRPNRQKEATRLFPDTSVIKELNSNVFVNKCKDMVLNFIRNVYIKRCWANKVKYIKKLNLEEPDLFFNKTRKTLRGKYYYKLNCWKEEDEYRIGLSLGGRKSIQINESRIKQVILGYNITNHGKKSIIDLLKNKNIPIKKINKDTKGFTLNDISQ